MWPYIDFNLFDISLHFNTNNTLYFFCMCLGSTVYIYALRKEVSAVKTTLIALISILSALVGARLFHVFFERPQLLQNPELIFTRLDGLTFYGGFFLGLLAFYLFNRFWIQPEAKVKSWAILALMSSLSFSIMKVGCYANGCCWGRISSVPWAVRFYNRDSVMPLLGLPVHPVQLYDALGGFLIFLFLLYIFLRYPQKHPFLFAYFCFLYPILRFITEIFRADHFRGENILLNLSTSQVLSIFLFISAGSFIIFNSALRHRK